MFPLPTLPRTSNPFTDILLLGGVSCSGFVGAISYHVRILFIVWFLFSFVVFPNTVFLKT